ncbi:hypothetical protein VAS14_08510 [Vibrio angustum S14]|uniref:Uncharacterized protein n=1 Tax=Photobacterium angustum (strain S14 / CCUG 15956) TaxID=314292 RepID=Q1ZN38_PHOAS|nr:hypothetical protein VAS14_08510 [Vibrio angustum S14] [Photobacterium angustum S14]
MLIIDTFTSLVILSKSWLIIFYTKIPFTGNEKSRPEILTLVISLNSYSLFFLFLLSASDSK